MKKYNKLTATALKNELWETLQDVKSNRCDSATAIAIAAQSREIMRVMNTELRLAVLRGKAPSASITGGATEE